jgi:hypothetical protein
MIRVINNRSNGSLFHYAHFICDCLFPEIINEIYNYKEVIRKKNIVQTIGNFYKIYMDVMMVKNTELLDTSFNNLNIDTIQYQPKEKYIDKKYFDKFRNFIFSRYKINNLDYNNYYPEVLLVKRGNRKNLIDDDFLKNLNKNITTGKERREINNIHDVELYLKNTYCDKFMSIYFENIPFEEQVKYFNNAKLIICAHGAVLANIFFCKEYTKIIEITCNVSYPFFDKIAKTLNLNHIKCIKNEINEIIKCIELHTL